jgi:hypothetical protein
MKKHLLSLMLLSMICLTAEAQHFYKDLVSHEQLIKDMTSYRQNKIRKIQMRSFESDGSPSKGFFCKRSFSRDYRKAETGTRTSGSAPSLTVTLFNENGSPASGYDSSEISATFIEYSYDASGRIHSILSTIRSSDDDFMTAIREEHIYFYNVAGQPEKMWRIVNNHDTSIILFGMDEKNNVNLEKNTATGSVYYYYYDENNHLTDIVRESPIHGRLMPDYIFAYDDQGRLEKMMSTEEGNANYNIWKYSYNDRDLRSKEEIYSKEKILLGKIEYEYQ